MHIKDSDSYRKAVQAAVDLLKGRAGKNAAARRKREGEIFQREVGKALALIRAQTARTDRSLRFPE